MSERAGDQVIIDQACGLKKGIDCRWAAEFEPRLFQVLGNLLDRGVWEGTCERFSQAFRIGFPST